MRRISWLLSCCLSLSVLFCSAQVSESERQAIVAEGLSLYRLERASWDASDLLTPVQPREMNTMDSINGYLSYRLGNLYNTIFFGGENNRRVYANFVFDSLVTVETAVMDLVARNATKREMELINMRQDALERITTDQKGFFKSYEKTSFNLIPIITEKERKVVVLTGPQENGNVLFGNDYVLEYAVDKFKSQTALHRNLVAIPMENDSVVATIHSHVSPTSEYITPTDICTLLLYGDYTNWKKHYVISGKFVSIWDLETKSLSFITRKEFDKAYGDQSKKKAKE